MSKYTTTLVRFDQKNEQGEYTNREKIKALDIVTLDNDVRIAFGYEGLKRKPSFYIAVYDRLATILSNNINEPVENMMIKLGDLKPDTSTAIINRYKELKLI